MISKSTQKYIGADKNKQAPVDIYSLTISDIEKNPLLIAHLSELERKYVDYILWMQKTYLTVWPCNGTIGKAIGCTGRTVQKIKNKLKAMELVDNTYRHRDSSSYRPSPFFYKPGISQMLKHILPTLGKLVVCMSLLKTPALKGYSRASTHPKEILFKNSYSNLLSYEKNKTLLAKQVKTEPVKYVGPPPRASNPFLVEGIAYVAVDMTLRDYIISQLKC